MGADGLLRSLGAKLVVIIMRLWVKHEYYWCPTIDSIRVGLRVWGNEGRVGVFLQHPWEVQLG